MILPVSYANGFAPRDGQPLYPELWRGCVGAWAPCLGPSGLVLRDWSGFGNHGTLTNMDPGTAWIPSQGKIALDFDGSNDRIVTQNNWRGGYSGLIVSAWGDLQGNGNGVDGRTLVSCPVTDSSTTSPFNHVSLGTNVAGNLLAIIGTGAVRTIVTATDLTFPASGFAHVAMMWDGRSLYAYLNGSKSSVVGSAVYASVGGQTANLYVGSYNTNNMNYWWQGRIDDVMILQSPVEQHIKTLSRRRGIAYELAPVRRSSILVPGFKAAWVPRQRQIIGGGL